MKKMMLSLLTKLVLGFSMQEFMEMRVSKANQCLQCQSQTIFILAPICESEPPHIWNAIHTKTMSFDYIGQKIVYQCKPGYEFPLVLLEKVNVTDPVIFKEPIGLYLKIL